MTPERCPITGHLRDQLYTQTSGRDGVVLACRTCTCSGDPTWDLAEQGERALLPGEADERAEAIARVRRRVAVAATDVDIEHVLAALDEAHSRGEARTRAMEAEIGLWREPFKAEELMAAVDAACEEAGWDWKPEAFVPSPQSAMGDMVVPALRAFLATRDERIARLVAEVDE